MNIFISHQQDDNNIAESIYNKLQEYSISAYLDVYDNDITNDGKELTEHLKQVVRKCTDIFVVMSDNTKKSSWVPFEIGMAAERDLPTVTFLRQGVSLPEYLEFWPRLTSLYDISKYLQAHMQEMREESMIKSFDSLNSNFNRMNDVNSFYKRLKNML